MRNEVLGVMHSSPGPLSSHAVKGHKSYAISQYSLHISTKLLKMGSLFERLLTKNIDDLFKVTSDCFLLYVCIFNKTLIFNKPYSAICVYF